MIKTSYKYIKKESKCNFCLDVDLDVDVDSLTISRTISFNASKPIKN